MIKKCCGNDVAAFAAFEKLSLACNVCMYGDRWKYVCSGSSKFGERFLCHSQILALIFVDL